MMAVALMLLAGIGAGGDLDAFLENFQAKRAGIETLSAAYTQTVNTPDESVKTQGALVYVKPRRIIQRTDELVTMVAGTDYYEYEPGLRQLLIDDVRGTGLEDLLFFGFDADTARLQQDYVLHYREAEGAPLLTILPKPTPEKKEAPFIEVALHLDKESLLPTRIAVQRDSETQIIFDIEKIAKNKPLKETEAFLHVPAGTLVVRYNEVEEAAVGEGGKSFPVIRKDAS